MSFITDAQLQTQLAVALKVPLSDVQASAYWPTIVTQANNDAYWGIVGELMSRGYSKAQVDTWDRGGEFQASIGLYWAITKGGSMGTSYDAKQLDKLDRRQELNRVLVTAAGVQIDPVNDAGQIGHGTFDTSGDLFVPIDPNDPLLGRVANW